MQHGNENKSRRSTTLLKISGVAAAIAALTLIILLPIYFTVIDDQDEITSTTTKLASTVSSPTTAPKTTVKTTQSPVTLSPSDRVDCYPEGNATQKKCEERGCTWTSVSEESSAPTCYFSGPKLYKVSSTRTQRDGIETDLVLNQVNGYNHYGQNFPKLTVRTTYISETTIRIKISPEEERYEIPLQHPKNIERPARPRYEVQHVDDNSGFGIKVTRRSTSRTLFDTSFGELLFSDQFLQISAEIASKYVYGFGEHMHEALRHDMEWKTYGMFSRDNKVEPGSNLYGVHPYFVCLDGDDNAYGVYLANSNAMDITLQPKPAVTYRTIGGILDFYVFLGLSIDDVTAQFTEVIGRPFLPPYWSLGFQLSKWGYDSLENLMKVVDRNLQADIPYEVQYSDIDHMERLLDFTIDEDKYSGLGDYVHLLKTNYNIRYMIILNPMISGNETSYLPFDNGIRDDVFIKSANGEIILGEMWPTENEDSAVFAAYPDFYHPNTSNWWSGLITDFHKQIQFDGLWINMNEPSSFVNGSPSGCPASNVYEDPPYLPEVASQNLYDKTICMSSMQYHPSTIKLTEHYNMHSLYGLSESSPTLEACRRATGERCFVLSRSTFPGSGKYAAHWLGENTSTWSHLAASVIGMLEFNLFAIPYVGADVCGYYGDTTYELCLRWMQLGAFYPFYRNHNTRDTMEQDPASFGPQFISSIKGAMEARYNLLPYLYTLFYDAHLRGTTVVRSLLSQFSSDNATFDIDRQFMWGNGLLITPVLEPNVTTIKGYFPKARWFDYYTGLELSESEANVTLDAPLDRINLHLHGGNIIPTQKPAKTTYDSRLNAFGLIVVLDENGKANGKLFWDDGISIDTVTNMEYTEIEFSCEKHLLKTKITHSHNAENMTLGNVTILGLYDRVTRVKTNGGEIDFNFDSEGKQMTIFNLNVDLKIPFEIRWEMNEEWKRIDCMPSKSERPNRISCQQRGCVWNPSVSTLNAPSCYFPYTGIAQSLAPSYRATVVEDTENRTRYRLTYNTGSPAIYGLPFENLDLEIEYQTSNRLHFKITDSNRDSFEIPKEIVDLASTISSNKTNALYDVEVQSDPFSLNIIRKLTGDRIFDSSVGPLIFEEQYLQISTSIPSELIIGFGEHNHKRYRHDLHWKRWGIFARDMLPIGNTNLYGHHTFFMAIDDVKTGSAVGVYLHNSNAMDVVLQPEPTLTYRTTGGALDFYVFLADSQEQLVQDYHKLIGFPAMPPYWGLGFQLSRWGYDSLERVKEVVTEMREAEIPFDVQYGDIDYMQDAKDFTYDKINFAGLPEFVEQLHDWGMKYVIILDPAIKIEKRYEPYESGMRDEVFIMNENGTQPVVSRVWPGLTHHIDFTHPNTPEWWSRECENFHQIAEIKFDALWVDMNEPSSFVNVSRQGISIANCKEELNKPPYMPKILWSAIGLNSRTICMESRQYLGRHYDIHSLYGHTMAAVTQSTLERIFPNKRSFVISRSTFAGTGKHAGHWLGDNQSLWSAMSWAITGMIEFNLFGLPYVGADICGFMLNADAELCQRWMQVGAFYPFSRNHNAKGRKPQHPTAFGPEVTASSKKVLEIRYSILPYMYTLHCDAYKNGGTVVRSLVHEFPSDANTWDIHQQFLLGGGFLITPVLEQGSLEVTGYFPSSARWYDFHTYKELDRRGNWVIMDAPLDHINLHVRGGTIIPMQDPAVTTVLSRGNPMSVLVALDDSEEAFGELYWDDGEARNADEAYLTTHFNCSQRMLRFTVSHYPAGLNVSSLQFERITVLGIKSSNLVDSVTVYKNTTEVSGSGESPEFQYEPGILKITDITLPVNKSHIVIWTNDNARL